MSRPLSPRVATRALCFSALLAALGSVALPAAVAAQQAGVDFAGLRQDTSLPVQVEADQLQVDQADGAATFTGNVRVAQGKMRLAAAEVRVEYAAQGGKIERLHATGGVTLASDTDAAEAREAVYTIESGQIVMTGDVLLTQGASAISGQKLVVNLQSGTGTMEGRVQTVFQPGGAQ